MVSSELVLQQRLRELLERENISGREFARRAQLHHQQAHEYITGAKTPGLAVIDRICAAFPPIKPWDLIRPDEPISQKTLPTLDDVMAALMRIEKKIR